MKRTWISYLYLFILLITVRIDVISQYHPGKKCVIDVNRECVPNVHMTAVPFLRITPDARSGAMGDAGLATSPDANGIHFNASKLALAKQKFSLSASYTPWLRELGLTDVYLAYLSGYYKPTKDEAIGFSLRFFSLGDINFTDLNGNSSGTNKPREFELSGSYARKLGDNLSAGLTAKFISSNLATGAQVRGTDILTGKAGAVDISLTYHTEIGSKNNELTIASAITNIGSKIGYTNLAESKEFLPANIGIGAAYKLNINSFNSLTFVLDINKLLVPTPQPFLLIENPDQDNEQIIENPEFDLTGGIDGGPDGTGDYSQQSLFSSIFGSFSDARGGFSEETRELTYSLGAEYLYNHKFAVRTGYFFEHELSGARQYLTFGLGMKYKVAAINVSYLIPTTNRSTALDNTLRLSLVFDGALLKA